MPCAHDYFKDASGTSQIPSPTNSSIHQETKPIGPAPRTTILQSANLGTSCIWEEFSTTQQPWNTRNTHVVALHVEIQCSQSELRLSWILGGKERKFQRLELVRWGIPFRTSGTLAAALVFAGWKGILKKECFMTCSNITTSVAKKSVRTWTFGYFLESESFSADHNRSWQLFGNSASEESRLSTGVQTCPSKNLHTISVANKWLQSLGCTFWISTIFHPPRSPRLAH